MGAAAGTTGGIALLVPLDGVATVGVAGVADVARRDASAGAAGATYPDSDADGDHPAGSASGSCSAGIAGGVDVAGIVVPAPAQFIF